MTGALDEVDRCERQAAVLSDRRLAAYATFTRAYLLGIQGDTATALEEARRAVERAGDPYTVQVCRCSLGRALLNAGDPHAAVAELKPATSWMLQSGFERLAWWTLNFLAEATLAAGDDQRAVELANAAVAHHAANGFGFGLAEARRVVARAVLARSEVAGLDLLGQSAQTFADVEAAFEEAATREELAKHLLAAGDRGGARAQLQRAAACFEACGTATRATHARDAARSLPASPTVGPLPA